MEAQLYRRVLSLNEKTQGYTVDGKPLLATLAVEKRGREYAVTLTAANLARLDREEYFLTVVGAKEETLRLSANPAQPLRLCGEMEADAGIAVLLWTEREGKVIPVAEGAGGKVKTAKERILCETMRAAKSPIFGQKTNAFAPPYQDEAIATENYFVKEKEDETSQSYGGENAATAGENFQKTENGKPCVYPETDADAALEGAERLNPFGETHPFFSEEAPSFFSQKKEEWIKVLCSRPQERALCNAVPGGYFVKSTNPPFILGVVTLRDSLCREDLSTLSAKEIVTLCYALPCRFLPPEGMQEYCNLLSVTTDDGADGYYVICQNPLTGNPERVRIV